MRKSRAAVAGLLRTTAPTALALFNSTVPASAVRTIAGVFSSVRPRTRSITAKPSSPLSSRKSEMINSGVRK